MKKSLILAGMLSIGYAYAQEGKVGVNTDAPKATMDIQPNANNAKADATTNEGILAPRLSKTRIANIETPVEGTLVYATDESTSPIAAYTGANAKVAKITEKGYYFYNGTEWVKASGSNNTDEFVPAEITDVYGEKYNGVKLVDTFNGINENRTLLGVSDKGGLYLNSDTDARLQVFGNGKTEFNVQTQSNASRGVVTVLGGSESYGQVYIGTRNNTSQAESLWSIQNVGTENTAPEVSNRLGDLGFRLGTEQRVLFKRGGRVSIGSNETPQSVLALQYDKGSKYKTSKGEDRYDVIHLHERENSAYGFGMHNSTLEIYGNDANSQIQIGKREADGTGVFTANVSFKGNGRVGIGTDNPTEKLDVDGKIKATSLAESGAGDRVVYADENGVLKTGVSAAANVKLATGTNIKCEAGTSGTMNFGSVTIGGEAKEAFGFCMKNSAGEYKWFYIYGGAGVTTGNGGAFGTGL